MADEKNRFQSTYTKEDYINLYYLYGIAIPKWIWVLVIAVVWTALFLIALRIVSTRLEDQQNYIFLIVLLAMLIFSAIYLPLYPKLTKRMAVKQVDKEYILGDREDNKKMLEVSPKGIHVTSYGARRYFSWYDVRKIKQNKTHTLLIFPTGEPMIMKNKEVTPKIAGWIRNASNKKTRIYP